MKTGVAGVRLVVSGVGVVSPIGIGTADFWTSLIQGRSGIGSLRAFPAANLPFQLAAEITAFDPLLYLPQKKFLKVMSRDIQLGVAAARLAMNEARLRPGDIDPDRLGVVYGAGRISTTPQELAEAVRGCTKADQVFDASRWNEESMGRIAPLWLLRQLPNMPACHVSMAFDARGPNNTITQRDASALLALAEAVHVIERGAADCMIVGACGSNVQPVDLAKLGLYDGLTAWPSDPARACRPFDLDRDGTIVGEGAAAFVIERWDQATRRGAEIYAEILGLGAGGDGNGFANAAGGTGLVRAIHAALKNSRLSPGQLGHVNAQGKSTQRDDLVEARAYHRALGEAAAHVPVTALKSYFGHSDAGSGAVELAGSLLAIKHGLIPQTLNYATPDPRCRLNVVRDGPIPQRHPTALCVNRTSIGQSAAVIIRAA